MTSRDLVAKPNLATSRHISSQKSDSPFPSDVTNLGTPLSKKTVCVCVYTYTHTHTHTHVLYGYETWSLTLREERRLRVFENRVLKRIFRPKRDEVTGEWRKLHNEELNDLYCSPNIVRVIKTRTRWAGHIARMGREEAYTEFWWSNLRENDNFGDTDIRWEDTIKMDLHEVGCWGTNWIDLAQDRDK